MDALATPRPGIPRPHEEMLAVVDGDRLLLASSALLDLIGYSRGEAASAEFRAAYLFHPDSPRMALSHYAGLGPFDVLLARPGDDPRPHRAFAHPLDLPDAPHARALLFAREDVIDAPVLAERVLRAVVASLRSATAEQLHRLRTIDEELATLGAAHPEELRHRLPGLLRARAGHPALDESIRAVERSVRSPTPLRGLYHRA